MQDGFDLVVLGEGNLDLVVSGVTEPPVFGQGERLVDKATLTIGSSGAITACAASKLGLRVAFVSVVGDDAFGDALLAGLSDRGIDVSACRRTEERPTGLTIHLCRADDRAMLTAPGTIDALTVNDVPERLLDATRHVHVAAFFLQRGLHPGLAALLAGVRARGATTSIDPNDDPGGQFASITEALQATDVFLPNGSEARGVSGAGSDEEALARLAGVVGTVAMKRGADGAAARRGTETARVQALPQAVVDTIGAGDAFNAGFLLAYLQRRPLAEALRLAVAAAGLSTRGLGGVSAQATLAEASALAGLDAEHAS